MNVIVDVIHNNGFKWYSSDKLFTKGYLFTENNQFIEGYELLCYLEKELKNKTDVALWLKNISGTFTFIYQRSDGNFYLYSDKTRYFPLFYRFFKDEIKITDSPELLRLENDRLNMLAYHEFQRSGFVTNHKTLIDDIYQIKASELLHFSNSSITSQTIFSYRVKPEELQHFQNPIGELKAKIDSAFTRLSISLKGKTPVLPLSGGFDSRLIACKLKENGFNNTICFTYGRPNAEVELSKKVAEKLGFKWYFINYEKEIANRNLLLEEEFNNYYKFAARYTSMFYLQEFLATEYLKSRGLIPENGVFIPGHSGDLLGGSQFIKVFSSDIKSSYIANKIQQSKFYLYPSGTDIKKEITNTISEQLEDVKQHTGYSVFEDWDIKEKISKFIFNSSQVFTYFGYQVRFPYWDNELVEFFRTLSPVYKRGKQLYDKCLKSIYFERNGVNFDNELTASIFQVKFQSFKEIVKLLLPKYYKYKIIRKNDWDCYYEMSKPMLKEIPVEHRKNLPHVAFNSVLINWYLIKIF